MTEPKQISLPNITDHLLSPLEIKLRLKGEWCHFPGSKEQSHYMISAHPLSDTAISLCFNKVVPIRELMQHTEGKKCIVCGLFLDLKKEALTEYIEDRQNAYAAIRKNETNPNP